MLQVLVWTSSVLVYNTENLGKYRSNNSIDNPAARRDRGLIAVSERARSELRII